jgi:hypothetical protein
LPYISSSHISLLCLSQSLSASCTISLVAINFRDTVDFVKLWIFRLRKRLRPQGSLHTYTYLKLSIWFLSVVPEDTYVHTCIYIVHTYKVRTYMHSTYCMSILFLEVEWTSCDCVCYEVLVSAYPNSVGFVLCFSKPPACHSSLTLLYFSFNWTFSNMWLTICHAWRIAHRTLLRCSFLKGNNVCDFTWRLFRKTNGTENSSDCLVSKGTLGIGEGPKQSCCGLCCPGGVNSREVLKKRTCWPQ